mmetsp:Transcript_29859/g.42593  ORF Transcript_29859/g.42593 Transcript_29859/m.42593 type:complete len:611 (-) Transcript_29859:68-1900(-)
MGHENDIEDLEVEEYVQNIASSGVKIQSRIASSKIAEEKSSIEKKSPSYLPGSQRVWLKTYGCSHNVSDSEYMEGLLKAYGYEMVTEQKDADVWVLNSCTVKDPSQAAFMHLVTKAKSQGLPVVVAGCVPQADRTLSGLEDVSMLGISQIDRVVEAVEQTVQGNTVRMLAKKELPRLDLPKVRKNPLVEIIPLSTGCLGNCTYCKTRQARGKLGSYALEAIVDRVREVCEEGVSEIWLSSEDTGAYGRDIGTDIGKLLRAIIEVLPAEGVMLRVGMTNPPFILEHLPVISEVLRHPKVFSFLHIPVQAGSDRVLTAMNREYTVAEFRTVADYLLANVPGVTIATDIICGFPNETEADFDETLALMAHYQLPVVNISQFYPRPGTPAAKMRRLPTDIVKDRSRRLTRLFEGFDPHGSLVGQKVAVWFDVEVSEFTRLAEDTDEASTSGGGVAGDKIAKKQSVGHTKAYTKVLVPLDESLPGSCQLVHIIRSQRFHVEGVVLQQLSPRNVNKSIRNDRDVSDGGGSRKQSLPVAKYGKEKTEAAAAAECCGSSSTCCMSSNGASVAGTSTTNSSDSSSTREDSGNGSYVGWSCAVVAAAAIVVVILSRRRLQ